MTGPCPWCGAWLRSACEMEDDAGFCPWDEYDDPEPDPDILREDRDEQLRLEKEDGYGHR